MNQRGKTKNGIIFRSCVIEAYVQSERSSLAVDHDTLFARDEVRFMYHLVDQLTCAQMNIE